MTAPAPPILAEGLAKRFGSVTAVSHIDLELASGQALGLLGPNGAGKSTTLSMLLGLTRPDAGTARIFGAPAGSQTARQRIGATPQLAGFPDQLTPREVLQYTAARYGKSAPVDALVDQFGLGEIIDRRVAGFSGGQVRRLALALAFAGDPDLVFLDEPTTGLDAEAQEGFVQTAEDYVAQGGALVLTSHHWAEIEAICDAITLIDAGETVLTGRIDAIRARAAVSLLSFDLAPGSLPPAWLAARHDGARWHAETPDSDTTLRRMVREDIAFANLTLAPLGLRDLIDRIRQEEAQS
ncbi:MAG: ABC transporter ATP-binding protein [Pseudomonadota bacterium]